MVCAQTMRRFLHLAVGFGALLPAQDPLAILEQHCVACHNPARRKSDLDLTERATLLQGGSKGPAVVPGDPDTSLLLAVVEHARKPFMPLRKAQLVAAERAALRAWIEAGAPYPRSLVVPPEAKAKGAAGEMQVTDADRAFWSFVPLGEPVPPAITAPERARNDLDRFWIARLDAAGIAPSPEADARTLVRRAYHTLIGLPPTPEQFAAYVATPGPDPFARLVDDLMAGPHFAERQARWWLDVARYADSGGYEFDHERPQAWPYRDFVIEAFHADLPFDEFVRLQVAADELRPDDPRAWRATGFLCAGPTVDNQENEQTRYDEYDDVVSTLGSAFLGLTVGCARCHDHKFDPIPTRDYYRLVAAFSTSQRVVYPLADAATVAAREEDKRQRDADEKTLRAQRDAVLARGRARVRAQRAQALGLDAASCALLASEFDPARRWRFTFSRPDETWMTPTFDDAGWPEGEAPFGAGRDDVRIATPWTGPDVWARRSFQWEGDPAALTFVAYHDEDVEVFVNGVLAAQGQGYTTDYVVLTPTPAGRAALRQGPNLLAVHCRQTVGAQLLDVVPVARTALAESTLRAAITTQRDALLAAHADTLAISDRFARAALTEDERAEMRALAVPHRDKPEVPTALIMTDRGSAPAKAFLLGRGDPNDKREELEPGFLQVLTPRAAQAAFYAEPPAKAETTGRRAALARWLTDVEHGAGSLLARVIVNRIWQQHMGRGLVGTPNDFGIQGDAPTHQELLEWLAQRLIAGGWRTKPIHRLIVTSALYRQASAHRADAAEDPSNRLWHRREVMRLDAESIRDAVLVASACLNPTVGGRSVMPRMHPDAIATGSTKKWDQDAKDGPDTWRRSLYVFMRRSVRFPMLEVFDAPDATASCGRRMETTTPLQALAMLNDAFMRNQAGHLARRLGDGDAIEQLFRITLQRSPDERERARAAAFLSAQTARHDGDQAAALTDLCLVALNLNEFLYID